MLSLHAAFDTDSLLIWREPEGGKKALLEALAEKRAVVDAMAWLPARDEKVVPSSPLLGDIPAGDGEFQIVPCAITAAALGAREAIEFLTACIDKHMFAPGLLAGDDLTYWTRALQFAGGLVARGRFLPGVKLEGRDYAARWTPVSTGPDVGHLHSLAKAMPPVARAVTRKAEEPDATAESVLTGFIGWVVDHMVRSAAGSTKPRVVESVHDRWMAALTSKDASIKDASIKTSIKDAFLKDCAALIEHVNQWQRPLVLASRAPFRLCFRLQEPQPDVEQWRVDYLLQGTKDPSLVLPAAEVWKPKKTSLSVMGPDAPAVREHLLVSLGQAAMVCAEIDESLKGRAPDGYVTDANGAYGFLRETAASLEQSGFGLMLPSWWTRKGTDVRLKARARTKTKSTAGPAVFLSMRLSSSIGSWRWEASRSRRRNWPRWPA